MKTTTIQMGLEKIQKNIFLSFFLYIRSFFYVYFKKIAQFREFQSTVWSRPAMIKIKTFKGKCHATKWRNWNLIYFTYFSMYFKDGCVCACTIKQDMCTRDDIPKILKVKSNFTKYFYDISQNLKKKFMKLISRKKQNS